MKKQLLSESEIRKFMKFASIGALSSNFVERLNETNLLEQEPPEEEDPMAPEPAVDDAPMDDAPPDDVPMDDLGDLEGEPEGDDAAGMLADALDTFLNVVRSLGEEGAALADAVTVSSEAGEGEEEMGEEPPMDLADTGEEEMPPGEEEEPVDAMVAEADVELEEDADVVSEVTRRVAKRLLAASKSLRRS